MKRTFPRGHAWPKITLATLLLLALVLDGSAVRAQDGDRPNRLFRQIGVMEKITDKLLLDSPNFLVGVGSNAHGLYLPEFGVVFTFEASLTGGKEALSSYLENLGKTFEVKTGKDGEQTIVVKPREKEKDDQATKEMLRGLKDADSRSAKLYQAGKEELIELLLDYGETLSELKDSQWVVIGAFMGNNEFFKENRISRMIMRVRMDDLRGYSAGRLTEAQVRARIQTEEY